MNRKNYNKSYSYNSSNYKKVFNSCKLSNNYENNKLDNNLSANYINTSLNILSDNINVSSDRIIYSNKSKNILIKNINNKLKSTNIVRKIEYSKFDLNNLNTNTFNKYFLNINNNTNTNTNDRVKYLQLNICKYLEYNEILNFKNTNKCYYNLLNKSFIETLIKLGCLSYNTRYKFWKNNINLFSIKELVKSELKINKYCIINDNTYTDNNITINANTKNTLKTSIYKSIISIYNPLKYGYNGVDKYNRPLKTSFAKCVEEISKDLDRTFHDGKFNKKSKIKNTEKLERILCSIAFIRPEIGYCQGMNFVAASLIEFLEDEEFCFWMFLYFLDNLELNSLYFENMPDYCIRLYQLDYYIKTYLNKLYIHFKKYQIKLDLIFSKWILTIFSCYLPFNVLSKVWDVFIIDKWKSIIKFSLIILSQVSDILMQMDLHNVSKYFRDNSRKSFVNFNNYLDIYIGNVCLYYKSKYLNNKNICDITNESLDDLREEYFKELAINKLNETKISKEHWEADQCESYEIYLKEYENLQLKTNKNFSNCKLKLEYYNKLYKSVKDSYIEVKRNMLYKKQLLEEVVEANTTTKDLINLIKNSKKKDDKIQLKLSNKKLDEIKKKINCLNKELLDYVRYLLHIILYLIVQINRRKKSNI